MVRTGRQCTDRSSLRVDHFEIQVAVHLRELHVNVEVILPQHVKAIPILIGRQMKVEIRQMDASTDSDR